MHHPSRRKADTKPIGNIEEGFMVKERCRQV